MLIENLFSGLFKSSSFFRIVFPHIKPEYFNERVERILFETIRTYYNKYNKQGTISDIKLMIETDMEVSDDDTEAIYEKLQIIKTVEEVTDEQLLINKIEEWCKNRALELAILSSVDVIQKNEPNKGIIEDKIKEALSVQFEVKIGHDYKKDAKQRLEHYTNEETKITLDNIMWNKALGGGLARKAIYCLMSRTNLGKSLWMCHAACSLIKSGKNVLMISLEMSEEELGKRIDSNMLDIPMDDLGINIDKVMYKSKLKSVFEKNYGKLIIKDYPTGTASALHVKNLINEIKLKKGFSPDVLIVDYLNICASSRLSSSQMTNTYSFVKAITEEFRALANEFDCSVLTATQTNRSGSKEGADKIDVDSVADSFGLPQSTDWLGAIVQSSELKDQGKFLLKVIKTRFASNNSEVVTIGVDYTKMRLINLDESDQEIPLHVKDQLKFQQKQQETKEVTNMFDFE